MKLLYVLLFILSGLLVHGQQGTQTVSIYFPFDKHALTGTAREELDKFVSAYKEGTQLTIKGYCDPYGTEEYNDQLSDRRTESVQSYLVQNGIPASAIVLRKGFGEREPLNENRTAEERQQNRRVDLIWTTATVAVAEPPRQELKEKIDSVKVGETIRLQNINFYGGSHRFLPESMPALNELLDVMKNNPTLVIEIHGHICCFLGEQDQPDYDANDRNLSRNRARAVYDHLASNGIDISRMSYKGFAGTVPLVYPERTEADRTANRRVEVKIVRK